jgi:hypothetical protein
VQGQTQASKTVYLAGAFVCADAAAEPAEDADVGYFVATYLGFTARLYDGSFEEWSRHQELPVATGPDPAGRRGGR